MNKYEVSYYQLFSPWSSFMIWGTFLWRILTSLLKILEHIIFEYIFGDTVLHWHVERVNRRSQIDVRTSTRVFEYFFNGEAFNFFLLPNCFFEHMNSLRRKKIIRPDRHYYINKHMLLRYQRYTVFINQYWYPGTSTHPRREAYLKFYKRTHVWINNGCMYKARIEVKYITYPHHISTSFNIRVFTTNYKAYSL